MKMEQLKVLAAELKKACDAEVVANVRAQEQRRRRLKIIGKIEELLGRDETYSFLQMMKSQAGCQSDDDFCWAVDADLEYRPAKPRVV